MRTPNQYTKNLKDGIVTTEMMRDAIFSVNKRAKNYRDAERKSRNYYGWKYADTNMAGKEAMYETKEKLLSFLMPVCIHREFAGRRRVRKYSYEKGYDDTFLAKLLMGRIVWMNSYFDYGTGREISFFDYEEDETIYRYYLYYICGTRTFHRPIGENQIGQFNLEMVDIGQLDTHGEDITDLLSMQFVNKILAALTDGNATYKKTLDDDPPHFKDIMPDNVGAISHESVRMAIEHEKMELIKRIRAVAAVTDEAKVMEAKKNIYIKQELRYKKRQYTRPDIKKAKMHTVALFKEVSMIEFVFNKLKDKCLNEQDLVNIFYDTCLSMESPVYDKLLEKAEMDNANKMAYQIVRQEANALYQKDCTRRIVNDNGIVRYANL